MPPPTSSMLNEQILKVILPRMLFFRALLHNGWFATVSSQHMCHKLSLFHDFSMIKDERKKKSKFLLVLTKKRFPYEGKALSTKFVVWCSRGNIHHYVAAPFSMQRHFQYGGNSTCYLGSNVTSELSLTIVIFKYYIIYFIALPFCSERKKHDACTQWFTLGLRKMYLLLGFI